MDTQRKSELPELKAATAHTTTDVVSAIRTAKEAHGTWSQSDTLDRCSQLLDFLAHCSQQVEIISSLESTVMQISKLQSRRYSVDWALDYGSNLTKLHLDSAQSAKIIQTNLGCSYQYDSLGLVAIQLSGGFLFRTAIERIIPACLAGNVVVLDVPMEWQPLFNLVVDFWQEQTPVIQVLSLTDPGDSELLRQHPSIASVVIANLQPQMQMPQNCNLSFGKNLSFSINGKNSVVLLELPEQTDLPLLNDVLFLNSSRSGFNAQRVFCLEKHFGQWQEYFSKHLQSLKTKSSDTNVSQEIKENFKNKLTQAISEGAKVLAPNDHESALAAATPIIVYDLPYCSELQSEDFAFPLITLNQCKYQHEFSKWINVINSGNLTCIMGDAVKATKVGTQLFGENIFINTWIDSVSGPLIPNRGSHLGIRDLSPRSSLFTRNRCMTVKTYPLENKAEL